MMNTKQQLLLYNNQTEINLHKVNHTVLKKSHLIPLDEINSSKIYYEFLEILHRNMITDKSNAFNKVFNLFLCKFLDEERTDDEMLEFQWIEKEDTYEILLERLNNLYKIGMSKYLQKDVIDYSSNDLDIENINEKSRKIINELRLYRTQEFTFIDVYNEQTFRKNAEIIVEIVKLLQRWQVRYTHNQQILGDFFESLIDTGFKQEAGQFFTPLPLVKFILNSLPINEIVQNKIITNEDKFLPYIMDFACGSGHFLTESINTVNDIFNEVDKDELSITQKVNYHMSEKLGWAKEYIHGIEKEYKLVKASKLSSFLMGNGHASIMHASGIDSFNSYIGRLHANTNKIELFDVLVANPPYAVKGFKSEVKDGSEAYTLFKELNDNSNEIEVLFIERMLQLLKPNGVAGIILPISVLNNDSAYESARRLIFENFKLKSIVILSKNAFPTTRTKTAILFMKKREKALHLLNSDDYKQKLKDDKVIVVKSLNDNNEKRFLGYEFTNRRGSKRIKIKDNSSLFNDKNRFSNNHINSYILHAMLDKEIPTIDEKLTKHLEILSIDNLLDYQTYPFSNKILINKYNITHKDESILVTMNNCISILESGHRPKSGCTESGIPSLGGEHIDRYTGQITKANMKYVPESFYNAMRRGHVKNNDILICKDGAYTGKCAYYDGSSNKYCINEHLFIVRADESICIQMYLFFFMMSSFFQNQVKQMAYHKIGQPGLNKGHIKKIIILLLSIEQQKQIISEIESEWNTLTDRNDRYKIVNSTFEKFGLDNNSK